MEEHLNSMPSHGKVRAVQADMSDWFGGYPEAQLGFEAMADFCLLGIDI